MILVTFLVSNTCLEIRIRPCLQLTRLRQSVVVMAKLDKIFPISYPDNRSNPSLISVKLNSESGGNELSYATSQGCQRRQKLIKLK